MIMVESMVAGRQAGTVLEEHYILDYRQHAERDTRPGIGFCKPNAYPS